MSLLIELPPELEQQLRHEAARVGRAPEELARDVLLERFSPGADRVQRIVGLLDAWDAEDEARPESGPLPTPPRTSVKIPDLG